MIQDKPKHGLENGFMMYSHIIYIVNYEQQQEKTVTVWAETAAFTRATMTCTQKISRDALGFILEEFELI